MDERQKEWIKQYNSHFGAREFLRIGCALLIWTFILVALSIALGSAGLSSNLISWIFSTIFVITILVFPLLARSWKPIYSFLRKVLGNENLPTEPMPRSTVKTPRQPLPWLYYVLATWRWLLGLIVLYFIIRYVLK